MVCLSLFLFTTDSLTSHVDIMLDIAHTFAQSANLLHKVIDDILAHDVVLDLEEL